MGITCNIPVCLPVDQKQCSLREDKYIEMLWFFFYYTCDKITFGNKWVFSHILYHCTPATCKAHKVFHAVCMAMLAANICWK